MRAREYILADINVAASGRATDLNKSNIAKIEMIVKTGDDLYRRRQYEPALDQFRQARGEIYSMLYPAFDVGAYLSQKDIALPASPALENDLLSLSGSLVDTIRPTEVEVKNRSHVNPGDPLPNALTQFTHHLFIRYNSFRLSRLIASQCLGVSRTGCYNIEFYFRCLSVVCCSSCIFTY